MHWGGSKYIYNLSRGSVQALKPYPKASAFNEKTTTSSRPILRMLSSPRVSSKLERLLLPIALVLLGLNTIYKVCGILWLHSGGGNDFTGVLEVERPPVVLEFDNGAWYGLDAVDEWASLVPGDGLVYLGSQHEPFMVSMFHELRCLDIIRGQLIVPRMARKLGIAHHCMNYLRQMVLCRGDTFIDPYQYPSSINPIQPNSPRRCVDWEAVYHATELNQQEHAEWLEGGNGTRYA